LCRGEESRVDWPTSPASSHINSCAKQMWRLRPKNTRNWEVINNLFPNCRRGGGGEPKLEPTSAVTQKWLTRIPLWPEVVLRWCREFWTGHAELSLWKGGGAGSRSSNINEDKSFPFDWFESFECSGHISISSYHGPWTMDHGPWSRSN